MKKYSNSKLIIVIVIATVFGMLSGFVGQIVARAYLLEDTFNVPFFTEIDFRGGSGRGSGIIIRNPKKVVVEQNEKVGEIVDSALESIVGIYKEKKVKKSDLENNISREFVLSDYYSLSERVGEALVITSDGWLISAFAPKTNLTDLATTSVDIDKKTIEEYVVITNDDKIYEVERVVVSNNYDYSFWRIDSKDLIVREIIETTDIKNGQILIGVDIEGKVVVETVKSINYENKSLVRSSDNFKKNAILSEEVMLDYFFFNLEGGVVGFSGVENNLELIGDYIPTIENLLMNKKLARPTFGFSYVLLSDLVAAGNDGLSDKGAIVYGDNNNPGVEKGDSVYGAGLRDRDIILSVNNTSIDEDNDLAYLLSEYKLGDTIEMEILRGGENKSLKIEIRW